MAQEHCITISISNFHCTTHCQVNWCKRHTRSHSQTHTHSHACRLKIAATLPFCTLSCWGTHPLPRWSPAHRCWSVPWSSKLICHRKCQVLLLWTEWIFWSIRWTMEPERDLPLPCQEENNLHNLWPGSLTIFDISTHIQQMCRAPIQLHLFTFHKVLTRTFLLRKAVDLAQCMFTGAMWILSEWGKSSTRKAMISSLPCRTTIILFSDGLIVPQKSMSETVITFYCLLTLEDSAAIFTSSMAPNYRCILRLHWQDKVSWRDPDPDNGRCSKTTHRPWRR